MYNACTDYVEDINTLFMIDHEMAERLVLARSRAGYKRALDATEALNWKYSTYASHENGGRGFARHAAKYAEAFEVDLEWLLTGKGSADGSKTLEDKLLAIINRIPDERRNQALEVLKTFVPE